MDRVAWRTTVHKVAKSQTQMSNSHFQAIWSFVNTSSVLKRPVTEYSEFWFPEMSSSWAASFFFCMISEAGLETRPWAVLEN